MRQCLFCDQPASSKEDAWPLWLLRRIGASGSGEVTAQRGKSSERTWPQAKAGLRVGCVCSNCNSGWMSQLETRAKPLFELLLVEEKVTLNADAQEILAMWATKSAMVYEGIRPNKASSFTADERVQLRESSALPLGVMIWIAMCVDPPGPYTAARDLHGYAEEFGFPVTAYVATMGFGPLAFQVMKVAHPNQDPIPHTFTANLVAGPWDKLALQLWPPVYPHLSWPAEIGLLGEDGLDAFNERWRVDT